MDGQVVSEKQVLAVLRVVASVSAVSYLAERHRRLQLVALPVAAVAVWWRWWAGAVVVAVALALFLLYRLLVWLIERIGMPSYLREPLFRARDELRAEYERLDLPTGPITGPRFVWRLLRGKRPHAPLFARMQEGLGRACAIVDQAMADVALAPYPIEPTDAPG